MDSAIVSANLDSRTLIEKSEDPKGSGKRTDLGTKGNNATMETVAPETKIPRNIFERANDTVSFLQDDYMDTFSGTVDYVLSKFHFPENNIRCQRRL